MFFFCSASGPFCFFMDLCFLFDKCLTFVYNSLVVKELKNREKSVSEMAAELKNIARIAKKYLSSIVIFTLMALFSTIFGILTSLVSQSLIDFVTKSTRSDSLLQFRSIYAVVGAAVAFSVFRISFTAVCNRISEKIRIKINTEMTADIFDKFICSNWEYTSLYASGDILNRFNNDVATVSGSVIGIFPTFVSKAFQFAAAFAVVFYYDKTMAFIALIAIPLTLVCSRFLLKKMHAYAKELKKVNSKLMAFNADALLNMQYLKSFGLVSVFCRKLRKLQREYIRLNLDYNKFSIIATAILSFITQMVTYACFGWGVYRLWSDAISIGTLVLFIELYSMLSSSFSAIIGIVPTLINSVAASERLTEIQNLPKDDDLDEPEALDFFSASLGKKLVVSLKNVTFRYKGEEEDALKNVFFTGKTGDFIALTGPSGEGKTTILRLLLSLIAPNGGIAAIGCEETGETITISPATRRFFSYVPQKNTMFGDTLSENMRLVKPDATDEEILSALKIACAYDFVMKEKAGINCRVGDGGTGFSEGQMQRLSIARALLRNAPIVLFDEATSALDVDTEKQILENLAEWGKDKICIFTTHRTSVFEVCNKAYIVTGAECSPIL